MLAAADSSKRKWQVASSRNWPARPKEVVPRKPIQVAETSYKAGGLAIDFVTIPGSTVTTFTNGTTFYIQSSYHPLGGVTFQPGCTIKFKTNANIHLTGPSTYPATFQTPVFTSRNDDGFGDKIVGVPGETDSDGDPAKHPADAAIWSDYVTYDIDYQNARFRWCKTGILIDTSYVYAQRVSKCLFEQITGTGSSGVNLRTAPNYVITSLSDVQKCNVTTPITGNSSAYSGTMTDAPLCTSQYNNWFALSTADTDSISSRLALVPDTMGAAGVYHFVELVNRNVAIFGKDYGNLMETASASLFFYGDETHPNLSDPRILYDSGIQRWIATMLDPDTGNVRLVVSTNSSPLGLQTWRKFTLQTAESGWFADFPTLGKDGNGFYVALRFTKGPVFNPTNWMYKIVPIKKPSSGEISTNDIKTPLVVNSNAGYNVSWIYPALNFDTTTTSSVAWFISKGQTTNSHPTFEYGRLQWTQDQGGNWSAGFLDNPWTNTITATNLIYDLDNNQTFTVPQKGWISATNHTPDELGGSRISSAVIRNGFLWTCHVIGLDGTNINYDGGATDRTAIAWYKIAITNNLLSFANANALTGHIWDSATTQPYYYMFPSLMVNSSEDLLVGFSGSRTNEYIGSFYWGRRNSNSQTLSRPTMIHPGRGYYDSERWGDYSACSLDPNGSTIWSIQQHAEIFIDPFQQNFSYGLWVIKATINP
jgi:hypothetical protein